MEYFDLKKYQNDEETKYFADINILKIERLIYFLEKNKINCQFNNEIKNYLDKLKHEREEFNKKKELISNIK